jgi:hypothetical protein
MARHRVTAPWGCPYRPQDALGGSGASPLLIVVPLTVPAPIENAWPQFSAFFVEKKISRALGAPWV